jgi:uracil-DNA glycosylase family 4
MTDNRHWSLRGTSAGDPGVRCNLCSLCAGVKSVRIDHRGSSTRPKLMIVGEAPGREEDEAGAPFVGPAGGILDKLLADARIPTDQVQWTNVVRCRPPDNRPPSQDEIGSCSPYLWCDIERFDPDVIIPLGNSALSAFDVTRRKITKARGQVFEKLVAGKVRTIIPTFHPAAILRGAWSLFSIVSADLSMAYRRNSAREKPTWSVVNSTSAAAGLVRDITRRAEDSGTSVAFDVETVGLDPYHETDPGGNRTTILGVALSDRVGDGNFIPLWHQESEVDVSVVVPELRRLLLAAPIIAHNSMFDSGFARVFLCDDVTVGDDTLLMSFLLFAGNRPHDLETCSMTDLGALPWKSMVEEYRGNFRKIADQHYGNVPLRLLGEYACYDVEATLALRDLYFPMIWQSGLGPAYKRLLRAVRVFGRIEQRGAFLDLDFLALCEALYPDEQRRIEIELKDIDAVRRFEDQSRKRFSPGNYGHVRWLLYNRNGLALLGRVIAWLRSLKSVVGLEEAIGARIDLSNRGHTKMLMRAGIRSPISYTAKGVKNNPNDRWKAVSTGDDHLAEIERWCRDAGDYAPKEAVAAIRLVREWKRIEKIRTSFFEPLRFFSRSGTYNVSVRYDLFSQTGRFRSSDFSVHTAPKRSDVRRCFVSEWRKRGGVLLTADYSQIELRVMASCAGDPAMIGAFMDGRDIHRETAAAVFGRLPGEVTGPQRDAAKTINFGVLYGRGATAISEATGMGFEEATALVRSYFERFPKVEEWIADQHRTARERGLVEIPTGRLRFLPLASACDCGKFGCKRCELVKDSMREAQNTPIQGAATDICLDALLQVQDELVGRGMMSRCWLFHHDAISVDVFPGELQDVYDILTVTMRERPRREFPWLKVPTEIDVDLGVRWAGTAKIMSVSGDFWALRGKLAHVKELVYTLGLGGQEVGLEIGDLREDQPVSEDHYVGDTGGSLSCRATLRLPRSRAPVKLRGSSQVS